MGCQANVPGARGGTNATGGQTMAGTAKACCPRPRRCGSKGSGAHAAGGASVTLGGQAVEGWSFSQNNVLVWPRGEGQPGGWLAMLAAPGGTQLLGCLQCPDMDTSAAPAALPSGSLTQSSLQHGAQVHGGARDAWSQRRPLQRPGACSAAALHAGFDRCTAGCADTAQ
jgi:hypothetical protein